MERGKRALSRSLSTLSSALLNIALGSGLMLLFDGSLPSDADGGYKRYCFLHVSNLSFLLAIFPFFFLLLRINNVLY